MLNFNKQALGKVTRSRTALAIFAATVLTGGTASEASARPDRHHGHHHQADAAGHRAGGFLGAGCTIRTAGTSGRSMVGIGHKDLWSQGMVASAGTAKATVRSMSVSMRR